MIRVRLQRNQDIDPRFRQGQCILCGGGENVIAAGYGVIENGGLKGVVICPTCLKSENLTTRILAVLWKVIGQAFHKEYASKSY